MSKGLNTYETLKIWGSDLTLNKMKTNKIIQVTIFMTIWVFLLSAISRLIIALAEEVHTIEHKIILGGIIVLLASLFYFSAMLIITDFKTK